MALHLTHLRGTVRPCSEHGEDHYHVEFFGTLEDSPIVVHGFDPRHFVSEEIAEAALISFAHEQGVYVEVFDHEEFIHSNAPEMEIRAEQ